MSLATALLTPILGDASPWGPQRLFQLGEAGGWYDPSDLTAEKVAWRRNLLTWSEDFTNAAWTAIGTKNVTANTMVAPDGTLTADTVTDSSAVAYQGITQTTTISSTSPYTLSLYVLKTTGGTSATFGVNWALSGGTGIGYNFRLNTDTGAVNGGWTAVSDGAYWRLTATASNAGGNNTSVYNVYPAAAAHGSLTSDSSAATGSAIIWGAQIEASSTATAYQRITDFTSDFLAAFPTHVLYQDSAGTTPVTALGQPVGLVIDKSRGGLANLGTNVIANGTFASGASWTAGTGWSIATGVATKTAGTASVLSQAVTLAIPGTYRLVYTMTRSAGTLTPRITGGTTVNATARSASGTYTEYVTTVTGNTTFEFSADASFAGTVDDVALQLVPGVHAIQPTSASRPLLDGRVNLLTFSEQFDNAAWSKTNVTVAANAAVAPDNTTTADEITDTSATGNHEIETASTITPQTTSAEYDISWRVKKSTVRYVAIGWWRTITTAAGAGFDLDTGTVTGTGAIGTSYAAINASMTALSNGWYECRVRVTGSALGQLPSIFHRTTAYTGGASTFFGESYAGSVSNKTLLWGADLRLATDAAYPYQRVAAATDYADVGVPRSFLFDGFDDSLYTASNMDLSGTDKVTVLAGVRKLSDAARGMFVELGLASANNFYISAPNNAGSAEYNWIAGGTVLRSVNYANAAVAAPNTSVLTGIANIPAPLILFRVNGTQVGSDTQSQGTGNFASAILYIGRRTNTTLPFNGKAYQLIVRGALTDTATLAQADRYVGAKTGIFL